MLADPNTSLPPGPPTPGAAAYTDLTNATLQLLNATQHDDDDLTTGYSLAERVVIGIVLSLLICMSIFGNFLVCVAIVTDRYLRKTSNYFIVSLAIADMLVAVLVMSFAVANDVAGYWMFGPDFCSIWLSSDVMCCTSSILNLCAISLDRYIHIRSPLHYDRWVTSRRTLIGIASIWILSAFISFLPIHLGWHRLDAPPSPSPSPPSPLLTNLTLPPPTPATTPWTAVLDLTGAPPHTPPPLPDPDLADQYYTCLLEINPIYAVLSSMVSFYIPCLVMILLYFRMYQYARMHVKTIKKQFSYPGSAPLTGAGHKHSQQYKLADHKAAITLGVIMGTFLFCWVPFFTINIIGAFCTTCIPPVVFSVFTWLGYINSSMNPVIYSIFNTEFRDAFKRVLGCSGRGCRGVCGRGGGGRGGRGGAPSEADYGRPIRANGSAAGVEYGAVSTSRKSSRDKLMSERITSV